MRQKHILLSSFIVFLVSSCKPGTKPTSNMLEAGQAQVCTECAKILGDMKQVLEEMRSQVKGANDPQSAVPSGVAISLTDNATPGSQTPVPNPVDGTGITEERKKILAEKEEFDKYIIAGEQEIAALQKSLTNPDFDANTKFNIQTNINTRILTLDGHKLLSKRLESIDRDLLKRLADEQLTLKSFGDRVTVVEVRQDAMSEELTEIKARILSQPVLTKGQVQNLVQRKLDELEKKAREAASSENKESLESEFFAYPRNEARYSRTKGTSYFASISVPSLGLGSLLTHAGLSARADWTRTVEYHWGFDMTIAAKDFSPIFDFDGRSTRHVSAMCGVSKSMNIHHNTHLQAGSDLLYVYHAEVGLGGTRSDNYDSRLVSGVFSFPTGTSVVAMMHKCEEFEEEAEAKTSILNDNQTMHAKIGTKDPNDNIGVQCKRDADCPQRTDGMSAASGVDMRLSECQKSRKPGNVYECVEVGVEGDKCYGGDYTAEMKRQVAAGWSQYLGMGNYMSGYSTTYRALCARGLICAYPSGLCEIPHDIKFDPRPGQLPRDPGIGLKATGIRDVKYVGEVEWAQAEGGIFTRSKQWCDQKLRDMPGYVRATKDDEVYRLPTKYELAAIAAYDREQKRAAAKKLHRTVTREWYYVESAYSDGILGTDHSVWVRGTEGVVTLPDRDYPVEMLGKVKWSVYCVKPPVDPTQD